MTWRTTGSELVANYRNIRVKMKGGKTRIQRALVLASGKLKFVKNTSRRSYGDGLPKRYSKRSGKRRKGYVFTKARRAALRKAQRAGRRRSRPRWRRSVPRRRSRGRVRRRRGGGRGGVRLG